MLLFFVGFFRWALTFFSVQVQTAVRVAESVLAMVKVGASKLYNWLAALFDWDSILRTKGELGNKHACNCLLLCIIFFVCIFSAIFEEFFLFTFLDFIKFSFNTTMDCLERQVDTLQHYLELKIDQTVSTFSETLEKFANMQESTWTVGDADKKEKETNAKLSQLPPNTVYFALMENGGKSPSLQQAHQKMADSFQAKEDAPVEDIETIIPIQQIEGYSDLKAFFEQIKENPQLLLHKSLAALCRVVQKFIVKGAGTLKKILGFFFDSLEGAIRGIKETANEPIDVPVVSQLYSVITKGGTLTLLDLIALLIAIPGTVLYRLMTGEPMFPDDAARVTRENSLKSLLSVPWIGGADNSHSGVPSDSNEYMSDEAPDPLLSTIFRWLEVIPSTYAYFISLAGHIAPVAPGWLGVVSFMFDLLCTGVLWCPFAHCNVKWLEHSPYDNGKLWICQYLTILLGSFVNNGASFLFYKKKTAWIADWGEGKFNKISRFVSGGGEGIAGVIELIFTIGYIVTSPNHDVAASAIAGIGMVCSAGSKIISFLKMVPDPRIRLGIYAMLYMLTGPVPNMITKVVGLLKGHVLP